MRKYILIILICSWLGCGHFLFAQEVEWVKKIVGNTISLYAPQLAVSPNGNVAVAQMYVTDTVLNIDGRDVPPITGRTLEFYFLFADAKGEIKRIMQPSGRYNRRVHGLVADSSDNFYIAGGCTGVAIFDTIVQNNSMFFLKYDSKGKMMESLNSKPSNQSGSEIMAISASKSGRYLSGLFGGSLIINEQDTLKNGGGFLMKLDNENNFQWIKSIKGKIDTQPFFNNEHSIASDETGVIFAGNMHENLRYTFDTLSYQARNGDILLQKMDNAGNIVWGGVLGGADLDGIIEVKINNGVVYLAGFANGSVNFNDDKFKDMRHRFLSAIDFSTGKTLWIKKANVNSFAFTKTGQIVTVADFSDTLKVGNKTYISKTFIDTSIQKFSSDLYFSIMDSKTGEVIYDWQMGGHGSEIGPVIATDTLNNFYVLCYAARETELGDSVFDVGYGSFLAKISLPVLGISGNSNTLQASVYPNPAALGKVSINFNLKKYGAINLSITDINGKKMQEDIFKIFVQGENSFTIHTHNYPNGKYFCSLQHDGIIETISFVIQK